MKFAENLKGWCNQWHEIVYSDEKTFQSFSNGQVLVKRIRGDSENPKYVHFAVQQEKYRVNVWLAIVFNRPPIVYLAGENFDASAYTRLLDRMMSENFESFSSTYVLQQDNASIHTAIVTKRFFYENLIFVLDWPPCSPDLNPVEHVWAIIQKKLAKFLLTNPIKDEEHLFTVIKNLASQISIEEVNNLIDSMPKRCKLVIASKGAYTDQ